MFRYSAFVVLTLVFMTSGHAEDAKTDPPKKEEKKPDEKKTETKDGYTVAEVGCAKCAFGIVDKCAPAVKIGTVVYLIKMDDKLDEKTKKMLADTSGKKETVKVKIKGSTAEENGKQTYYHIGELLLEN